MPQLSWNEVKDRAHNFSREWRRAENEAADKQTFWNDFFDVFGIPRRSVAAFEVPVRNIGGHFSRIDLFWRGRLLVEHKSRGQDLAAAESQAFQYIQELQNAGDTNAVPRYVLLSDFARFALYDLEPDDQRDLPLFRGRPMQRILFPLEELYRHVRSFAFMTGQQSLRLDPEDPANEKAYDRMCTLHDALEEGGFTGHALERLLVRVLFCVFAEDNGIFAPETFSNFIRQKTRDDGSDLGAQLNHLFTVLDTAPDRRQRHLDEDLAAFPYVNGQLFAERLDVPAFNTRMREALIFCTEFQWAKISPAVFGSLFQGVMEDRERRQQGAHYTSERDIMKVLRSLFLDELRAEFDRLKGDRSTRRRANLDAFHQKLRRLKFLDPACGCGNFLVLAYRELRALELDLLREITADGEQRVLDIRQLLLVDVDQFYGIEYSEWPVRIAEVALWLMDHQMNQRASEVFGQYFERLPLRSTPHITQGNALRIDWNSVLPRAECSYVLGNPPFVGKKEQNPEQKADLALIFDGVKGAGILDYVTGWYMKAGAYIQGTRIVVAFVSTNSITQGEQVGILWNELLRRWTIRIHFAHRTFQWASEADGKAHVHVVIVGFGNFDPQSRTLFEYDQPGGEAHARGAGNINPYLADAPNVVILSRRRPLNGAPEISYGSMMIDKDRQAGENAGLLLTPEARARFIAETPTLRPFIRRIYGGDEFLNGLERWCLWLVDAPPALLRDSALLRERIEGVRAFRSASGREQTQNLAATPYLFGEIRQPHTDYILIPKVSSENRTYIPIGFVAPEIIASGSALIVPGANPFHFGVLSSAMHNSWMRYVAGRLESRYQYSNAIVYNNFPWPQNPTNAQRERVEEAARAVLAAREPFLPPQGTSTLADLYDPLTMPAPLAQAHAALDRAVERCYRPIAFNSDRERVEFLFALYEQLTAPLIPAAPAKRRRRVP